MVQTSLPVFASSATSTASPAAKNTLSPIQRDAAAGRVQQRSTSSGSGRLIAPQQRAGLRVDRDHLIARRRDEHHAVVDDRRRLVTVGHAGREHPHRLQPRDVVRRDLIERAVAPAVVGAPDHQPVAVLRLLQPLGGDGRVVLQDRRKRRRWRRLRDYCARGQNHDQRDQLLHCASSLVGRPFQGRRVGAPERPARLRLKPHS